MRLPWVYIGQRLVSVIPILLGVTFLVVAATDLIPGSPAEALSSRGAFSQEQIAEIEAELGWDKPLAVRYFSYLERVVLHGDLGRSFRDRSRDIRTDLLSKVPATAELTLSAMLIAMVLGISIGIAAALKPASLIDYGSMMVALLGISFPVFWLGLMLQILIFPAVQRLPFSADIDPVTGFFVIDTLLYGEPGTFLSCLKHLALPATALSTIPMAIIARMTRASMLEAMSQDYVRTARAKGLSNHAIVLKHGLRNALIPIVTVAGLQLAALLGGAVLTETVFQWPGLGFYIFEAAITKDLPALQGAVLFIAVVFTLLNLCVDISYGVIDPRIRVGERT
jgi:ABC-type dipeptide/oligopeptide/nickel transport system permease component